MTKTTELNAENGTCIGCRLPWNGESGTGYCKNAVLVIADDNGMEVTEILLPLNVGERKNLAEPEISTGQPIRKVLELPLEQWTHGGQTTLTEPDILIKHSNQEEPEISAKQSTPGEKLTPAEPDIPIKHPNREQQGVADDQDMPVKLAAPTEQITQPEPEPHSGPEIIIGVRV